MHALFLACACLLVSVVVMAQPADKMTKYYKRTGQKFLDEKAKVRQPVRTCRGHSPLPSSFPFAMSSQCSCCSQEEGVHKLPSGMLYRVLKTGKTSGKKSSPNVGDSCEVTYSGKLKDGTPFDSGTTSFAPNQVIKGWTEALQVVNAETTCLGLDHLVVHSVPYLRWGMWAI